MRVFIISDMEGIAGVTKWAETDGGEALHADRSRLYTEEINAAVRGAYAAGATEVVVMDCHGAGKGWTFNSLIPDQLDPRCDFVVQQRVDRVHRVSRAGLRRRPVRGHARDGGHADGVMNHTVSGTGWRNLSFNGTLVGETGINAALCGTWGCPVLMVTGDRATCREAEALLGERADHGRGEAGAGPLQRPPHLADSGARADRVGRRAGACPT